MKYRFSSTWIVLLLLAFSLLPTALSAAEPSQKIEITAVDIKNYPDVRVLVAAPSGALPSPDEIKLAEDGKEMAAEARTVTSKRTGVALSILIDLSRSMRGQGIPGSSDRLQDAREQTIALAQALDPKTDLLSIFTFNRDVTSLYPLSFPDGGRVNNEVAPKISSIPGQPSGSNKNPSAAELRADPYAYSSVSKAIGQAIEELTNPQTSDVTILDTLPFMQKVIVIFSDSCDDVLDALKSTTCEIPLNLQTQLQDVVRTGNLSIIAVGVGSLDARTANPKVPEKGFNYLARYELLQTYVAQIPDSRFFTLYASDKNAAANLRAAFKSQVIDAVVALGEQLEIRYTSQVKAANAERKLEVSSQTLRTTNSFVEPAVPPRVAIASDSNGQQLVIHPEIRSNQAAIVRVDYYIDNDSVPISGRESDFKLDLTAITPGPHMIAIEATDSRGLKSVRSTAISVEVPVPPPPPNPTIFELLKNNLVALIALLIAVVALIVVFSNPRTRDIAKQAQSRVTEFVRKTVPLFNNAPVPSSNFMLVVRQGPLNIGQEFPINQLNTHLGGDKGFVDIVLEDDKVSGRHLSFNCQSNGNELIVTDVGSSNGTILNQNKLEPHKPYPLKPGDRLTVGSTVLECVWRNAVGPMAPTISLPTTGQDDQP